MPKDSPETFEGFSPLALELLANLKKHNSKSWFEKHKDEYHRHLLTPMQRLVALLSGTMLKIDPRFEVRPAINRAISRIYRDTRFSRDKSLYKESIWMTFKRPSKQWIDAPSYFLELFPTWYRYGMGFYQASRATMDLMRRDIDRRPENFVKVVAFYSRQRTYRLAGDKYVRLLPSDHPAKIQDWYQRKSFYLVCDRKPDDLLFSSKLAAKLGTAFLKTKPLYQYLMKLKDEAGGA